jgi:hypothetical protein
MLEEEVVGRDPSGLLAQELPPSGRRASRRRVQPVAAQRGADCGSGEAHAKPEEFAPKALVAPARVLIGQRMISCRTSSSKAGRPWPWCG